MKSNWRNSIHGKNLNLPVLLLVLVAGVLTACNRERAKETQVHEEYTCPMHPQVVKDKPGTCPVCGMDLVKKSAKGQEVALSGELIDLIKPTNTSVVAAIETLQPVRKALPVNLTAPGVIAYDTRKNFSVSVRFAGRIEKLFLKYNFQPVQKDQVIMEIYSPELITAQRELLYVVNEHPEQTEVIEGAKQKLMLLGLTPDQVEGIIRAGKESFAFPVLSPYSGYIVETSASLPESAPTTNPSAGMGGGGMNSKARAVGGGMPAANAMSPASFPVQGAQFSIREGMYVTRGQGLFKVIEGKRLWAELYFPAPEGAQIKKEIPVELRIKGAEKAIQAKADFIQPFFTEGRQFLQVRAYIHVASEDIRVGQLLTAYVALTQEERLWIPRKAILDLGAQQIVFIKTNETFIPYKIKTGVESNGMIEIIDGLEDSDEIAANAQFLVDSESFIKVSNPAMK